MAITQPRLAEPEQLVVGQQIVWKFANAYHIGKVTTAQTLDDGFVVRVDNSTRGPDENAVVWVLEDPPPVEVIVGNDLIDEAQAVLDAPDMQDATELLRRLVALRAGQARRAR